VLDKAVVVLDAVASGAKALADLVTATGLPRATAHRLAVALEANGLLRRDGDGRFALGLHLAALGRAAATAFPLAERAGPALERLRDETGESVQLYVRDGDDRRRCIASLDSPNELRTIVAVGARLPLNRGSAGKVLLGATTRRGWIESVEEREAGVASVSAPVFDGGAVVAAVSVSGPVGRTTRQPGRRYGDLVVAAATEISSSPLGSSTSPPGRR
jgi:DNA-binding IclR family transcriptional regulator